MFNVKNQGGKGTPAKEVKEDIDKHSKFIRMLKNYKSTEDNCFTPIHTVICDFANEKTKFGNFETNNENAGEHFILLNKTKLETANFNNTWFQRIPKIPDVDWTLSLDVLVGRLIALASIEGAASLIHEQMTTGLFQSTSEEKYLECQLGSLGNNQKLKEIVAEHSEIENRRRKKRFILWTKAQIAVFADEKTKFGNFETINEDTGENIIVLNKKDLETANFIKTWISRIAKIPDVDWKSSLDVLVARMIALASIEGATTLIHEQMITVVLQSTKKKEDLECQLGSFGYNEKFKETVSEHSEVESRKGKKRFILWTKAQIEVIVKVFKHVTSSQKHGLRLLVTGGRGTGNTMLLVVLAKMVQSNKEFQTGERTSRTMVMEGTLRAEVLIAVLKQALHSNNVTFLEDSGEII